MSSTDLSFVEANSVFTCNPQTGQLFWKNAKGTRKAGAFAGTINTQGYIQVQYNKRIYRAHRIIYTLATGQPPEQEIDHLNGDRTDNRISNLRAVSRTHNCRNTTLQTRNNTGYTGIMQTKSGSYEVRITLEGKSYYLGRFSSLEEAVQTRQVAEIGEGFHPNHGKKQCLL